MSLLRVRHLFPPNVDWTLRDVHIDRSRRLGSGAYGEVFAANWKGCRVAAKKIHDVFFDKNVVPEDQCTKVVREFALECGLQAKMRHPHIVQLYGVYFPERDDAHAPVMVSELMEETLRARILRAPRLTVRDVTDMCLQIASAVRFLHEREEPIAHRDLSSNNVMLTSSGVCKVGDVGLAKIFTEARRVGTTMKPGTEPYMPGEVLMTGARYNEKLDVFSLGVLMLEMSIGHEPRPTREFSRQDVIGGRRVYVAISEVERRQSELNELGTDHLLRGLVKQMLEPQETRPSIGAVFDKLELLGSHPNYESSQNTFAGNTDTARLASDLREVRSEVNAVSARLDRLEANVTHSIQSHRQDIMEEMRTSFQQLGDEVRQRLDNVVGQVGLNVNESLAVLLAQVQKDITASQKTLKEELQRELGELRSLQKETLRFANVGCAPVDRIAAVAQAVPTVLTTPLEQRKWREQPAMPGVKEGCQAVQLDSWLVVLSGKSSGAHCCRVFAFETLSKVWHEWSPTPYANCAAASDGWQVIVAGGCPPKGGKAVNSVFYLDESREWKLLTNMPRNAFQCASAIKNGRLYILGNKESDSMGAASRAATATLEVFDLKRAVWLAKEHLSSSVSIRLCNPMVSTCLIPLGKYLVTDRLVCYDTETKTSSDLPTRDGFRPHDVHHAMTAVRGQLLVCGGVFSTPSNEVHTLCDNRTWTKLPPMITPRMAASACTVNGVTYVVGGVGLNQPGSNILNTIESFE